MKKIVSFALALAAITGLVSLTSCKKQSQQNIEVADFEGTPVEALSAQTKNIIKNSNGNLSCLQIADKLISENSVIPADLSMATMEVSAGYLNGFDGEVSGFTEGAMFGPMVGSFPLVGFILKTDDPASLTMDLSQKKNLNWNICTSADDYVSEIEGNFVIFIMGPNSFHQK